MAKERTKVTEKKIKSKSINRTYSSGMEANHIAKTEQQENK